MSATYDRWVKSSFSGSQGGNCVELAFTKSTFSGNNGSCVEYHQHNDEIHVRDSKDPEGPVLRFTGAEWDAFILGAKDGQFDRTV